MHVEISIASTDHDGRIFLTWTPVQATARLIDGPGAGSSVRAVLRNAGSSGKIAFDLMRSHRGTASLQLDLPGDGSPIRFWVAGEFQQPSLDFGDAVLEVVDAASSTPLGSTPLMVRIRKNAQTLSAGERDRFLAAFGIFNGQGSGRFSEFREMHVRSTLGESHGNWGFLPWHRSYLLDLERELQSIDARVTLPYWRFDEAAPRLFTPEFMGLSDSNDRVQFAPGHPFEQWRTEGQDGILRRMGFSSINPPGLKTKRRQSSSEPAFSRRSANPLPACPGAALSETRTDWPIPASDSAGSFLLPARPAIPCSFCCMPTSIGCGRNGNGSSSEPSMPTQTPTTTDQR